MRHHLEAATSEFAVTALAGRRLRDAPSTLFLCKPIMLLPKEHVILPANKLSLPEVYCTTMSCVINPMTPYAACQQTCEDASCTR